ncbi:MAG: hypothetical protein GYB66_00030 [Chloroflexi bacterium]|nr:hypothetical protein [Chloroflexota bacterium]
MSENIKQGISRRRFLIGAAGVSVVACGGIGYLGLRNPSIDFIEQSYPSTAPDSPAILVAYGSQFGSTGGVADAIAQALNNNGASVDVRLLENARDVARYNAVVVGAPVHTDAWMPDAVDFVKRQRATLRNIPVVYFLTCMTLALSDNDDDIAVIEAVFQKVQDDVDDVRPIERGLFAGALDYSKMSLAMNLAYRFFSEDDSSGDFRDFDAIRTWANTLYPRLVEVA